MLALGAHHLTVLDTNANSFGKPTVDTPELLALRLLVQTGIENKNWRNAVDSFAAENLPIRAAFIAKHAWIRLPLKAFFEDPAEGRRRVPDPVVEVLY